MPSIAWNVAAPGLLRQVESALSAAPVPCTPSTVQRRGDLSACLSLSLSLCISIGSSNRQSREEKKFAGLTKSFLTDDLCPGKGPDRGCLGSLPSQTLSAGLRSCVD